MRAPAPAMLALAVAALLGAGAAAAARSRLTVEPATVEGGAAAKLTFKLQAAAGAETEIALERVEDCLLLLTSDRSPRCARTPEAKKRVPLGALRDEGGEGDSMAGDQLYSLTAPLDAAGPRRLTFAAALPGGRGPTVSVLVTRRDSPEEALARLADAAESGDARTLLVEFLEPDAKALAALDAGSRRDLAAALRRAAPADSGGDPSLKRFRLRAWAKGGPSTLELRLDPIRSWCPAERLLRP